MIKNYLTIALLGAAAAAAIFAAGCLIIKMWPVESPPAVADLPVAYDLGAKSEFVKIVSPQPGDKLTSPLTVTGQARLWYFEASFPIELKDANGVVLAVGIAQAQDDWMTESFVPFKAMLDFSKPTTPTGTLILKKDNPSGLPQYDNEVSVPVEFNLSAVWP